MTAEEAFRLASLVALFALLVVSAYTDIVRNKVYNWCTFPGMFLGLAFAYMGGGFSEGQDLNLLDSLLGLLAGGGIILLFSLLGGIGLGDVKLMAAVGALTGVKFVFGSLLFSSLVGFVMASGLLLWKGRVTEGLRRSLAFSVRWRMKQETPVAEAGDAAPAKRSPDTIPFGAAIAFGTLWAFFMAAGKVF